VFDPFLDDPDAPAPAPQGLDAMSLDELLDLRAQIDAKLPVKGLKDLDLTRELVLQTQALQALQQRVMNDAGQTPANQIAQCASSLSTSLMNLVKVQNDLFTSERLKKIESILVECVQTLPARAQEAFFDRYEKELGGCHG